jgi:hypothetical protein
MVDLGLDVPLTKDGTGSGCDELSGWATAVMMAVMVE